MESTIAVDCVIEEVLFAVPSCNKIYYGGFFDAKYNWDMEERLQKWV